MLVLSYLSIVATSNNNQEIKTTILRSKVFNLLKANILSLQGVSNSNSPELDASLGPIRFAFPNDTFPLRAVHEFLTPHQEDVAATSGFLTGLLTSVMADGVIVWISSSRNLFTPALKNFGVAPENFIFIDLQKEKEVIWAADEALKCKAIVAVVAEVREIDFITSRRLQLAVEHSGATGFILRSNLRNLSTTAAAARWKISSLPSQPIGDLPGIGFPKWRVELLKVRNGKPGSWDVFYNQGKLVHFYKSETIHEDQKKIAG
jgi:protein ImuA